MLIVYVPAGFCGGGGVGFEDELKGRRMAVEAEIESLRARANALEAVLASYDTVIAHCDPNAPSIPSAGRTMRRTSVPLPPQFQRLNKTEAVFEALRTAGRPISTAECVSAIAMREGVPADHPGLRRFPSHVSATLSGLLRRERVRQATATDGRTILWEVAT